MNSIHIASDHAGFSLKALISSFLADKGYQLVDHGTHEEASCDYPLFAHALCDAVTAERGTGILICGTGIGMSMAANRHPGIRAALCTTELHAKLAREHNNANVLCLGARMTGTELAKAIVEAFLAASFAEGRHERRVSLLTPKN